VSCELLSLAERKAMARSRDQRREGSDVRQCCAEQMLKGAGWASLRRTLCQSVSQSVFLSPWLVDGRCTTLLAERVRQGGAMERESRPGARGSGRGGRGNQGSVEGEPAKRDVVLVVEQWTVEQRSSARCRPCCLLLFALSNDLARLRIYYGAERSHSAQP
jgi:hypothetical protein